MAPQDVAVRPRRSAFAAAFLSFLFPGLGHAYLGRWLRALAWAILPVVAIAAIAGRIVSGGLGDLVELVADPDVLNALLIVLVIDLVYRLLALLDAYRLASDRSVGSGATRAASTAGLIALLVVLVGSHVVVARPIFFATDLYADVSENAGDETEVLSAEELAGLGEEFQIDGFVPATAAPTSPTQPTEQETVAPTPTPERPRAGRPARLGRQGAPQHPAHRV